MYVCPGKLTVPSLPQKPPTEQPCTAAACGVRWPMAVTVAEGLWLPQLHVGDWLGSLRTWGAYTVGMGSPSRDAQTCRISTPCPGWPGKGALLGNGMGIGEGRLDPKATWEPQVWGLPCVIQ